MRHLATGFLALALFGPALWAQDDKDKPKPDKPTAAKATYDALFAELKTFATETKKVFQAATKEDEKRKIFEEYEKKVQTFGPRFLKLAQDNPKDPVAVDALMLVLNVGTDADRDKAQNILLTDHIQSDRIGQVCEQLDSRNPNTEKLLRNVLEKSPHKSIQTQATYGLASMLKERTETLGLKLEEVQKLNKEAEGLFERVIKQVSDPKEKKRHPLAQQAEDELLDLRNRPVGKQAPEIEGADSDSKKFKLSDYKGKVVVLDFWAEW